MKYSSHCIIKKKVLKYLAIKLSYAEKRRICSYKLLVYVGAKFSLQRIYTDVLKASKPEIFFSKLWTYVPYMLSGSLDSELFWRIFLSETFSIFLKHLWLIPNMLKWQDCKIFTNLDPSQAPSRSSHQRCSVKKVFWEISQGNTWVGVSF